MNSPLRERDWEAVAQTFERSAPRRYVVLDGLLDEQFAPRLQQELLDHWAWRRKNWVSHHLHNSRPALASVMAISRDLQAYLPQLFRNLELVDHWCLLYTRNLPGKVHSDIGCITLTLWLTPDEHNCTPHRGGLVLTDVLRPDDLFPHEHLLPEHTEPYVAAHSRGDIVRIPYRCNRAVLFDARTYHKTDFLKFRRIDALSARLNLSFTYDEPKNYARRMEIYRAATQR